MTADRVPCVWVVASHRTLGNESEEPQRYTVVDEGGSLALQELGLQPLSYVRPPPGRLPGLLAQVDGVLLGGSFTNVHPRHYGQQPQAGLEQVFDEARDAVALPLVRLALDAGVPLLGICRGSQEFNVAMGGSLHQSLRALDGQVQHWEHPDEPLHAQYAERHEVACVPGGALHRLVGQERFSVSSLHSQGVRRLGAGLVAEAHADDGLVEAFRWHGAASFAWGFQFHAEWGHSEHASYGRIMDAFAQACWARLRERYKNNS